MNLLIIFILIFFKKYVNSFQHFNQLSSIINKDGHLIFLAAPQGNISFQTQGGRVLINNEDVLHIFSKVSNAVKLIEARGETPSQAIEDRLADLEFKIEHFTYSNNSASRNVTLDPNSSVVQKLYSQVTYVYNELNRLKRNLRINECISNPCLNSGTCHDLYLDFKCVCPPQWQGAQCSEDVNECAEFTRTDRGCQNSATCVNTPGSFRCVCANDWYGALCSEKSTDCSKAGPDLCGKGLCINDYANGGYKCLCEPGWTVDPVTRACSKDIDECSMERPPCSVQPQVQCINTLGSYTCAACPAGYKGNGFFCVDVDECATLNGGCSINPFVKCINTVGSRECRPCPPGYEGDGITCSFKGVCNVNNGGCASNAKCNSFYSNELLYVDCVCPAFYMGNGRGENGCIRISNSNACDLNPCVHGTCLNSLTQNYTCVCQDQYTGRNCDVKLTPCASKPCENNGTCRIVGDSFICSCSYGWTGVTCSQEVEVCGGRLKAESGILKYPPADYVDSRQSVSCHWIIETLNSSKVLNVTFKSFTLGTCNKEWLQAHDGRTQFAGQNLRFCGSKTPTKFVTSHNVLYLWFVSKNVKASKGFELEWNTLKPNCSQTINVTSHGSLASPGYPRRTLVSRDCYWTLQGPVGKRILFNFHNLDMTRNNNCSRKYLEFSTFDEEPFQRYCVTSQPAPLYSQLNQVVVHYRTTGFSSFLLTYTLVEAIPGCGGVYSALKSQIVSPSLSDQDKDVECVYKIQQPPNFRVKISFVRLDIPTPNCDLEYLAVYDGPTVDSPLNGKYCGNDKPLPYLSNGNELTVLYKSSSNNSLQFKIKFEGACGKVLTLSSGSISLPSRPNKMRGTYQCLYEIVQPAGKLIFLEMNVKSTTRNGSITNCIKELEVYDGENDKAPLQGAYCLQKVPKRIFSTHNYLVVKFTNTFEENIAVSNIKIVYWTVNALCGGILKAPLGTIASPKDKNQQYMNDLKCFWIISAPPDKVIQLNWIFFSLEVDSKCYFDYVTITENSTSTGFSQKLGTYCGSQPPPSLVSTSNILTITFLSDATKSNEGFLASYLFLNASNVCGGNYLTTVGTVKSPNYPNPYPSGRECVWTITVPKGQQIVLDVIDFQLEARVNCHSDYLEIRNGGSVAGPLIGQFCEEIPKRIPSITNKVYLKFVSDSSIAGKGFMLNWTTTDTGCGGSLTGPSGAITSPQYPEHYEVSTECYWKITVNQGSVIKIVITDISMEPYYTNKDCVGDYIEIFDGPSQQAKSFGRVCKESSNSVIVTTSNNAYIKFHSDISLTGRGFSLRYYSVCETQLTGFSGVIESPNFPKPYPNDVTCRWNISVSQGNKIKLVFASFDLEEPIRYSPPLKDYLPDSLLIEYSNSEDYVESFKTLGTYYGSNISRTMVVNESLARLTFKTDEFVTGNGFRIEWYLEGCGGILTRPKGSFWSPNYPKTYPNNLECQWLIQGSPDEVITLNFTEIDLETSETCNYDRVTIFDGPNTNSTELAMLCHQQIPTIITSSSRFLFVVFKSDIDSRRRGFSAKYSAEKRKCSSHLVAKKGAFTTPNYPQNFNKNETCDWLLEVDENHLINLEFSDIDLGVWPRLKSFVTVFDGPSQAYPLLAVVSSGTTWNTSKVLTSTSNHLFVEFQGSSLTSKGFRASFSKACGAIINTQGTGVIRSSHNLDFNYFADCSWTITSADPTKHVTLTISTIGLMINTYCSADQAPIKIYNGDSSSAPVLKSICSNKLPPMLISSGYSLHIVVSSSLDFFATYSVLDSHCGGDLDSLEGEISSPGYPDRYPINQQCEWTIAVAKGNSLVLSFSYFNLISSSSCNSDYLEIRKNNGTGLLLGVYCGSETPKTIVNKESLWMFLQTSTALTNTDKKLGFFASFAIQYSNSLFGHSGVIQSPGYPKLSSLKQEMTWTIDVMFNFRVELTLEEAQFEDTYEDECYDNAVTIYDGSNKKATVLGKFCEVSSTQTVLSSTNSVLVVLSNVDSAAKFQLSWRRINNPSRNTHLFDSSALKNESGCGSEDIIDIGMLHNYTLTSPGFPKEYRNNLRCWWIFKTDQSKHLTIQFSTVNFKHKIYGCDDDYIMLYTKFDADTSWKMLGHLCQNAVIRYKILNWLKVGFMTDYMITSTGFKGSIEDECGGSITQSSGYIIYDVFSRQSNCDWNITVAFGKTIRVRILNLTLNNFAPKCNNYVLIRDGKFVDSPTLGPGRYCGHNSSPAVNSSGNSVWIKYHGSTASRFVIAYEELMHDCGGKMVLSDFDNYTEITSPNYPNVPKAHIECLWTFHAPLGETIRMDFVGAVDFTIRPNCDGEYIEIRDGATEFSPLLEKVCRGTPSSILSSDNILFVKYFTNVDEPRNGFKARVTLNTCGGVLYGSSGVLNSPNRRLANNCTWKIVGPPGYVLNLTVPTHLFTPVYYTCLSDFTKLTISEDTGINNTENLLLTTCGYSNQTTLLLSSNIAIVRLFPKNINTRIDFSIKFTVSLRKCGEKINAERGTIASPGYPGLARCRCRWTITVPEGRRVTLSLSDLDLAEDSKFYVFDYGDITSAPILAIVKQHDPRRVFESTNNQMMILFWSIIPSSHRGFQGTFTSNLPSLCVGSLDGDSGSFHQPNRSGYICSYSRKSRDVKTLSLSVRLFSKQKQSNNDDCEFDVNVFVLMTWPGMGILGRLCHQTETPVELLSPYSNNQVRVVSSKVNPLNFTVSYRTYPCGGVLDDSETHIESPGFPGKHNGFIKCVWLLRLPNQSVRLNITSLDLGDDCNQNYLTIYNGKSPSFPKLFKFCKNNKPKDVLISQFESVWVEYVSLNSQGFQIFYDGVSDGCGGIFHTDKTIIQSPNYGKSYSPNTECVWTFRGPQGYYVEFQFIDRFFLENSSNCSKDYVEISSEWSPTNTSSLYFCGRSGSTTLVLKAQNAEMQVRFHSDNNTEGIGFKGKFTLRCGGVFKAGSQPKQLVSPGYPNMYSPNLSCSYRIWTTSGYDKIKLQFISFNLEAGMPSCIYNNLTLSGRGVGRRYTEEVFCGDRLPPNQSFAYEVKLSFRTDSMTGRKGFIIQYQRDECSEVIDSESRIDKDVTFYMPSMRVCTWNITAPTNKTIILHLEKMASSNYGHCRSHLEVYDSDRPVPDKLMNRVCGFFQDITFHSTSNKLFLKGLFNYASQLYASIAFSYGPSVGCGGSIALKDQIVIEPPRTSEAINCLWRVNAPLNTIILMDFQEFMLPANCSGVDKDPCNCGSVMIRDGISTFANPIETLCGNFTSLPQLATSLHQAYIRFSMPANLKYSVKIKLQTKKTACETVFRNVTHLEQSLSFLYPNGYAKNVACTWILRATVEGNIILNFKTFDLQNMTRLCSDQDSLQIKTSSTTNFEDALNRTEVVQYSRFFMNIYLSEGKQAHSLEYCGTRKPPEYSTDKKMVFITFKSGNKEPKGRGFELSYMLKNCSRAYTDEAGLINDKLTTNCTFTIQVPANKTITINFRNFYLGEGNHQCKTGFQIRENDAKGTQLLRTCSSHLPNSIASNSSKLWVNSWVSTGRQIKYTLTYTSTDKGPGCGGDINGDFGYISSPKYPGEYLSTQLCTWNIYLPSFMSVVLRVSGISIQGLCSETYIEVDTYSLDQKSTHKFCAHDSSIILVSKTNFTIRYQSSPNNHGSGWLASFYPRQEGIE